MIGILGFIAVFGAGRWLGWPARWVWLMAWGWLLVLLLAHAPYMPPQLGAFVGGEFRGWFVLGVLAALVLAYRKMLGRVRGRVTVAEVAKSGAFSPVELDRYARHIMLREIGGPGQKSLKNARVLVVGAGGLGSGALLYLAGSGVGVIGVIDGDTVEGSNLQRQIIHADARIGMPKVFSAEIAMKALNPFIEVRPYHRRLDKALAAELVADYDLVLDGTDNFDTRYLVNRVCAAAGKPLIAAAITQWEGQISLYDPAHGGPCFECVFPVRPAQGLVPSCAEAGVAAPLPGVIGAMMAMEAIKHLTSAGTGLRGRLVIHDALYAETRVIGVKRRAGCVACGGA
ncbi:molybdopterin-synthase adenylyltransferase MoeB [Pseudotabrizicola sediminis]|uniref:Molybdopterin-synthase adenylyltransferase MoeB n=1 Tax=Pseudotabrizicola sediminis TaxID=2486418 RepID=A0ABY2KNV0_9RHOB|nr:molybdopterin-synthase adenylyltransferase MoeB [Pseudotabrizicola sediminis]TGD44315.1 molybdopterin-synthase adenylyltransferase MoeB [Pseudotabrizicola sediminis]